VPARHKTHPRKHPYAKRIARTRSLPGSIRWPTPGTGRARVLARHKTHPREHPYAKRIARTRSLPVPSLVYPRCGWAPIFATRKTGLRGARPYHLAGRGAGTHHRRASVSEKEMFHVELSFRPVSDEIWESGPPYIFRIPVIAFSSLLARHRLNVMRSQCRPVVPKQGIQPVS